MKKILFFTVLMFAFANITIAQSETIVEVQAEKGPYLTNRFFDNWFISVGGGIQFYTGEHDKHMRFDKRLAPAIDVSDGKWITPSVGVRLQYAGLKGKGLGYGVTQYATDQKDGMYYVEKFNMFNIHADVMWNVSNAIGGYRMDRFWSFIPYAGFGIARTWSCKDVHDTEFAASFGLLHNLYISPAFSINVDMRSMVVNQRLDGVIGGVRAETMNSITAGITYNFGCRETRGFRRASDIIVIDDNSAYINQIQDLENQLRRAGIENSALAAKAHQAPKVIEVVKREVVPMDMAIFFEIGKADLSEESIINLGYLANVMKADTNKKYTLMASADKNTGTPEWNMKLSKMRGDAICKVLVEKYCVDMSQMEVVANGGDVQPFDKPYLNRVVILEQ